MDRGSAVYFPIVLSNINRNKEEHHALTGKFSATQAPHDLLLIGWKRQISINSNVVASGSHVLRSLVENARQQQQLSHTGITANDHYHGKRTLLTIDLTELMPTLTPEGLEFVVDYLLETDAADRRAITGDFFFHAHTAATLVDIGALKLRLEQFVCQQMNKHEVTLDLWAIEMCNQIPFNSDIKRKILTLAADRLQYYVNADHLSTLSPDTLIALITMYTRSNGDHSTALLVISAWLVGNDHIGRWEATRLLRLLHLSKLKEVTDQQHFVAMAKRYNHSLLDAHHPMQERRLRTDDDTKTYQQRSVSDTENVRQGLNVDRTVVEPKPVLSPSQRTHTGRHRRERQRAIEEKK